MLSQGGAAASGSIPTESGKAVEAEGAGEVETIQVEVAETKTEGEAHAQTFLTMLTTLDTENFLPHPPTPFPHDREDERDDDGLLVEALDFADAPTPAAAAVAECEAIHDALREAAVAITLALNARDMDVAKGWRARRDALEDTLATKVQAVTMELVELIAQAQGAGADDAGTLDAAGLLARVHALS